MSVTPGLFAAGESACIVLGCVGLCWVVLGCVVVFCGGAFGDLFGCQNLTERETDAGFVYPCTFGNCVLKPRL